MPRREPGIQTTHAHTRFRSRLEARWAAFFDLIGWRWEYEPFDLDGYIPDFLLLGHDPVLVEVKPIASYAEAEHIAECTPLHPSYPPLVVGCTPLLPDGYDVAGAIGQTYEGDVTKSLEVARARWGYCSACGGFCVIHDLGAWINHPDGHDIRCQRDRVKPGLWSDPRQVIERLWAEARNVTQWRAG